MIEEPDWYQKDEKKKMQEKCNQLIKKTKRWIYINIGVATFDLVYAIFTDMMIFKFMFSLLALFLIYITFKNNISTLDRLEKLKERIKNEV